MLVSCYALWGLATTAASALWLPLGMVLTAIAAALHSSLTHEALHGHPFRSRFWNAALVFPALSVAVPYLRFKDTHLAHHHDSILTDPYDDPESNYLDPAVWGRLPRWRQWLLRTNNTLAGRMVLGPAIGTWTFVAGDLNAIRAGDRRVALGWALHLPALALVAWWIGTVGQMPVWAWLLASYAGLSLLKIRTFLEHRAHLEARGRTVVIEDRGPLAWLFLNNNLHAVHHMHAAVPWYRLPALYRQNRDRYLRRNEGYRYPSYAEVFRRHLWRAKDPVPHPLWPQG
nr:fatty acid desaturase [Thetidibacter halocola]